MFRLFYGGDGGEKNKEGEEKRDLRPNNQVRGFTLLLEGLILATRLLKRGARRVLDVRWMHKGSAIVEFRPDE